MKTDLKKPCKNCPFSNTPTRIKFAGIERATEIAESAYRNGFPCHLSAVHLDEEDDPIGEGGFVPGDGTQHCAGALGMFARSEFGSGWPGIGNDEDEVERILDRMGSNIELCFETEEEFIEANRDDRFD